MFQHLGGRWRWGNGAGQGERSWGDGGERERGGGMNSCQVSAVAMAFHQATPLQAHQ